MKWTVLLGFGVMVSAAFGRVTANVPPEHSWYDSIDRLEAYGCGYATSRILRPQAYEDLRNAVYVADSEDLCKAPNWLLAERSRLFYPIFPNEASAGTFFQRNDFVPLTGLEGGVSPLYPLRAGRPSVMGGNLNLEFRFSAQMGREGSWGLAVGATPGVFGALQDYTDAVGRFYLRDGYIKAGYGWAELTFGKIGRQFGSAHHGTLLLSPSVRPMDSLEFSLRPHIVGGPFSFLGPFSLRIFAANLDRSALVDNARLGGLELSFRPANWLEVAWMELYQFGGTGIPPLQASDLLKMLIYSGDPALDAKRSRSSVFEIALREPKTKLKLYTQGYLEGASGHGAGLIGLWFPKVGMSDIRMEFVATAERAYTNPTYGQGLTREGSPLGHPLGPDALGGYFDLGFPLLTDWRGELGVFGESRDRHPIAGSVTENRLGGSLGLKRHWTATSFLLEGKYAYAQGAGYLPNETNHYISAEAVLSYGFY